MTGRDWGSPPLHPRGTWPKTNGGSEPQWPRAVLGLLSTQKDTRAQRSTVQSTPGTPGTGLSRTRGPGGTDGKQVQESQPVDQGLELAGGDGSEPGKASPQALAGHPPLAAVHGEPRRATGRRGAHVPTTRAKDSRTRLWSKGGQCPEGEQRADGRRRLPPPPGASAGWAAPHGSHIWTPGRQSWAAGQRGLIKPGLPPGSGALSLRSELQMGLFPSPREAARPASLPPAVRGTHGSGSGYL